jgi:hypothetical protein
MQDGDVIYEKFSAFGNCTSDNYTQMPITELYIYIIINL